MTDYLIIFSMCAVKTFQKMQSIFPMHPVHISIKMQPSKISYNLIFICSRTCLSFEKVAALVFYFESYRISMQK